jgi:ABC-type nitrate/sulfonate/bicarbonate transport system substrate-binding protein
MQVLASNEADIGIIPDMAQWMATFQDGNDWTAVGSVFQDSPGALVSLPDHPVRTVKDLTGQTVLGQEGTQILYDAAFKSAGMDADYKFTPVGFDISPLVEKQGVAYTAYVTNQPGMLEEQYDMSPDDYIVTKWSDLGLPAYANIIFGSSDYVKSHGDTVEKFLRASLRGWQENADDPTTAADLALNDYGPDLGLDRNQQIRENKDQQPLVEGDGKTPLFSMDPNVMNTKMFPWMKKAGYTGFPDATDLVDMTYLDAARRGLDKE